MRFLIVVTAASAPLLACHDPVQVCELGACDDAPGTDASSGAPGEAPTPTALKTPEVIQPVVSAQAGEGGAYVEEPGENSEGGSSGQSAACQSDADCSDGKACDGIELCIGGECRPGSGLACAPGTACVELETEAACFGKDPFLTYIGDDFLAETPGLVGLRLSAAGQNERIDLSRGALDAELWGVGEYFWAPNGTRFIFSAAATDFETFYLARGHWVDMRSGAPSTAARISDLPVAGGFLVLAWSPDSRVALIESYGKDQELYAVRFANDRTRTTLVASGVSESTASFCNDGATVVYSRAKKTYLAALDDPSVKPTELELELVSASPDGRWLLLSSDAAPQELYLAPCAIATQAESLAVPSDRFGLPAWSADSKYLAYSFSVDSEETLVRVWSVEDGGLAFEAPLGSHPADLAWQPGAARLLYSRDSDWFVKDVPNGSPELLLPIPRSADGAPTWLGASGELQYQTLSAEGSDYYLLKAAAGEQPRHVVHDPESTVCDIWYLADLSHVVYLQCPKADADGYTQAFAFDLTQPNAAPRALFDTPLAGNVGIHEVASSSGQQLFIWRQADLPGPRADVYVVPPDLKAAIHVNIGADAYDPRVQPVP